MVWYSFYITTMVIMTPAKFPWINFSAITRINSLGSPGSCCHL